MSRRRPQQRALHLRGEGDVGLPAAEELAVDVAEASNCDSFASLEV